jgi:hypothetical protein
MFNSYVKLPEGMSDEVYRWKKEKGHLDEIFSKLI